MAIPPTPTYLQKLHKQGVLPPNCRRVIIDVSVDEIVKVYYECYADQALLDIELPEGAVVIHVGNKNEG